MTTTGLEGFGLLVAHLTGDFVFQRDWQAKHKTLWTTDYATVCSRLNNRQTGHLACTLHCLLYTFAVWLGSFWWMSWWGLLICFLAHWPIDRFRLARKWMTFNGQTEFATGPLSPWSIIVVDNTWHLITLFVIALLH